jgi:hypothetical protein
VIECILSTDMAKHAGMVQYLKNIIESKNIKNGVNADKIINKENDTTLFNS